MTVITMKPEHFNKVTDITKFMDMTTRFEYEEQLCWMLNEHIKLNQSFDKPVPSKYLHNDMVKRGWLIQITSSNIGYILTRKSLGLLWSVFGKTK